MKILIIITFLFVRIESNPMDKLRNRIPPTDSEINILLNRVFDDTKIIGTVANYTIEDVFDDIGNTTVSHTFEMLSSYIERMKNIFAISVHGYIKKNLAIFCELAIEELDQIHISESYVPVPQDLVDKIKFDGDQDFCIFSFLFHYGYDVEAMEAAVYFLKTFELNKSLFVVFTLRKQIKKLVKNLYTVSTNGYRITKEEIKEKILTFKSKEAPKELDIEGIKKMILNFSKLFCLPTVPRTIVSNKSLLENEVEVYQKKVVGFMMNNEVCSVDFTIYTHGIVTQKELITQWNCQKILKNYEFGYESYKRFVQKKWKKKRDICFHPTEKVIEFRGPRNKQTYTYDLYSLALLKSKIQTERSYLNVLKYNNILTDSIIYFTSKEARKMLKGVKTLLTVCRNNGSEYFIPKNQFDMMRSSLFLFKMYYDKLIYIIRETIPEFNSLILNATEYDQLMTTTLNDLKNAEKEFVENCSSRPYTDIIKQLETLKFAYGGSRPIKLKFKQYYFLRPVLTMYTFYTYTLLYVI